jgi:hypothetical protein
MLYSLAAVALAAMAMTTFSLVLARIIPDRYDNLELRRAEPRRR